MHELLPLTTACIILKIRTYHLQNVAQYYVFIHLFIPLACAECDDSLLFSGASSIPLCYILFPATLLH